MPEIYRIKTIEEHQIFTNAWRKAIPYGTKYSPAMERLVKETAKEIYKNYPEIVKALKL